MFLQVSNPRPPSASAGTSPPVHRRASKWTKVKKAFLTSAPGRRDEDCTGRSNSVPSSPNRNSSFFDEVGKRLIENLGHEMKNVRRLELVLIQEDDSYGNKNYIQKGHKLREFNNYISVTYLARR